MKQGSASDQVVSRIVVVKTSDKQDPPKTPRLPENASGLSSMNAYLVLHRGSRWTDVYRLNPSEDAVLGRSSANSVVLRSGRASRRHARVFFQDGPHPGWIVEDLGSRNGVRVNETPISAATALADGDRLELAGFQFQFTSDLAQIQNTIAPQQATSPEDEATQGDISMAVDESECLDIVSTIRGDLLPGSVPFSSSPASPTASLNNAISPDGSVDRVMLRLALAMGRTESDEESAELLLNTLSQQIPHAEIGIFIDATVNDLPPPRFVHQRPGCRYRRPPQALLQQILVPGASAILARNIVGDSTLATENSVGEIDVEAIVLVPLHDPESDHAAPFGLVHVTTRPSDPSLNDRDLLIAVTASEVYCEARRSLRQRSELKETLAQSRDTISRLRDQLRGRVVLLGRSEPIREIQVQIARVAASNAAVLLRGESGTGKELVAAAIHHASARADHPMVCLNCAALSKDLLESELFGHEEGAFTGATARKQGKFEAASGGTLMLDEIGEMNLDLQAKLLRVLEGHPFERVGGQQPIQVDVRVIAATHRDLQSMVERGEFRQDLFYRLHVIEIIVPPLRERGRDITLLANHFADTLSRSMGRRAMKLSPTAEKKLLSYAWPGNVRELRNVIERAVVMSPVPPSTHASADSGTNTDTPEVPLIEASDLMLAPTQPRDASTSTTEHSGANSAENSTSGLSLAELERQHIARTLKQTGGNKSQASIRLGIERSTLDRKLKRYARESGDS